MEKNDIKSIISTYGIIPADLHSTAPQLRVGRVPRDPAKRAALVEQLKAAKAEIINYFLAAEAEAEGRARKISEMFPGIDALRSCADEWERWGEARQMAMDDPNGIISLPNPPETKYSDLAAKHPAAAAYLKAESYSLADNYRKAEAGKKAMGALISGAETSTVMAEMENWLPESAVFD